ncbi:PHD finger protein 7-like protein [Aix galericulata]|nr:PHD finger protein 7-like protein [Aix galericulata]
MQNITLQHLMYPAPPTHYPCKEDGEIVSGPQNGISYILLHKEFKILKGHTLSLGPYCTENHLAQTNHCQAQSVVAQDYQRSTGSTVTASLTRSFCSEHRPQQAAQAAPEQDTTCIICMDPVGDSTSYHTMVCPACNHAWFHRRCIQARQLLSSTRARSLLTACVPAAGTCRVCRHCLLPVSHLQRQVAVLFRDVQHGDPRDPSPIQVGIPLPCSQETRAQALCTARDWTILSLLLQRTNLGEELLCIAARELLALYCQQMPLSMRQGAGRGTGLLLCRSCAAEGTHRRCSNLTNSARTCEHDNGAGVGTSSQAALWPLEGILVTDRT